MINYVSPAFISAHKEDAECSCIPFLSHSGGRRVSSVLESRRLHCRQMLSDLEEMIGIIGKLPELLESPPLLIWNGDSSLLSSKPKYPFDHQAVAVPFEAVSFEAALTKALAFDAELFDPE